MNDLSQLLKTNEFAKLCNVHKKTLLYYDEIDLFKPYYTDANGYRYYSYHQYDSFSVISVLKAIDMPLKDIKIFMDNRSPEHLLQTLRIKQQHLKEHLEKLQHMDRILDTVIQTTSESQQLNPLDITLTSLPEEYLILSSSIPQHDEQSFFQILSDHFHYCSQHQLEDGHPIGALLPKEQLLDENFTRIRYLFIKTNRHHDSPHTFVKPSGLYVVGFHQGSYATSPETYHRLLEFINQHQLTIHGNSYEETLLDYLSSPSPEDYLTRISIQVSPPLSK